MTDPYCTEAEVEADFSSGMVRQIWSDGAGGVDTTALARSIARAQAETDSILGPDFTVPFGSPIAAIINAANVDLTIFFGYDRKPELKNDRGQNPETQRYDRAIKTIREIKSGDRDMGDEQKPASAAAAAYILRSSTSFICDTEESTRQGGQSGGF